MQIDRARKGPRTPLKQNQKSSFFTSQKPDDVKNMTSCFYLEHSLVYICTLNKRPLKSRLKFYVTTHNDFPWAYFFSTLT